MNHSQSDLDDDSDGDDKSIMFDIPEEIMEPVDDPGFDSDQMEDFGDIDGSFEPDGLLDDSALDESPNEPHSSGGNCGNVPEIIIQLQKQLLKGYTLPPCPTQAPEQHTLSQAEILSLQHYLAWTESHGTVKAYILPATKKSVAHYRTHALCKRHFLWQP
jgi:hypothetical protein